MTTTDNETTETETTDTTDATDVIDIDPRIEARREEVRREYGRKRLRVLVIVAVLVVALVGTYLTIESPLLDVDRVDVTGVVHLPAAQVRAAAAIAHNRALLRVDLGAVARRVERLPWVDHVRVHRDLPGTLRIEVTEVKAVAFVRSHGKIAVFGRDDRVTAWTHTVPAGAVEIDGVRRVPARGQLLSPVGVTRAVTSMPAELRPHVRWIALRPATVAVVLDGGEIRLGDLGQLGAKFASAVAVFRTYIGAPFHFIDVSDPLDPVSSP